MNRPGEDDEGSGWVTRLSLWQATHTRVHSCVSPMPFPELVCRAPHLGRVGTAYSGALLGLLASGPVGVRMDRVADILGQA